MTNNEKNINRFRAETNRMASFEEIHVNDYLHRPEDPEERFRDLAVFVVRTIFLRGTRQEESLLDIQEDIADFLIVDYIDLVNLDNIISLLMILN